MTANDSYQILMNNLKYSASNRFRALLEYVLTPEQAQMAAGPYNGQGSLE